jgi:ribonuclease P protein component
VAEFSFSKSLRLLTPRDFKQVFDAAPLKVSTREVLILARVNQLDHPRLGLVIAKKNVRRAVARNRIKRVIRETFRHEQYLFAGPGAGLDVVILARGGIERLDKSALHEQLTPLWRQLQRKAGRQQKAEPPHV